MEKQMLIRNLLVAGLALLAVGVHDASASVIKCNACTPDDYDHAARAEGPGRHVVYDLYHDRVAGFEVQWDAKVSAWKVASTDVPAELATLFGKLAAYHRTGAGTKHETVPVKVALLDVAHTETVTAYDLLNDFVPRKRMLDRLARGLPDGTWSKPMQEVFEAAHALGVMIPAVTDPYRVKAVCRARRRFADDVPACARSRRDDRRQRALGQWRTVARTERKRLCRHLSL